MVSVLRPPIRYRNILSITSIHQRSAYHAPSTTRNMSTKKTSHLERTAAEPREKELYETRLARVDQVNERVRLFRLELLSGPISFLPGQWLDTFVPGTPKAGGFTITSPPSAASAARQHPYLELAVQESPDNAPAAWLWRPRDEILGATVKVRVGGSFVFPPPAWASWEEGGRTRSRRKLVLVAGGVGVNPLMSMLSHIGERTEELRGLEVEMAYGSRMSSGDLGEIVFLDRITRLFGEGKIRGSVSLFVTGTSADGIPETGRRHINGAEVEVHRRRLTIEDLRPWVAIDGETVESTMVFLCGPPTMTDELAARLTSKDDGLGMDPEHVLTEKWW